MESKTKSAPEFRAKITPEQVKEQIANDKSKVANTQSEKAAKKTSQPAEKKGKAKKTKRETKEKDAKTVEFPLSARINDYGFIGLRNSWLAALGWHKGMDLKIDKNPDGSVTIRKA